MLSICPVCEACNVPLPLPTREDIADQYIEQQITKVYADTYVPADTDVIMFLDSDLFFTAPVTPETYMVEGKPRLVRESFERMKGDQSYLWKGMIEKALGLNDVEYEGMRLHPALHYPVTLQRTRRWFIDAHNLPVEHYAAMQPHHEFTEFNIISTVAQRCFADLYHIHTLPQDGYLPQYLNQGWSWSPLEQSRRNWMEQMLADEIKP